ncbi:uncharacterized protein LOC119727523 [Patiria miniata]|uniref:MRH domain-containing protein n=1 Tax=Patiria miniata TaxID=46514 RepID=A0A913ZUX0_PATMI|nr:uncharacterized protein LOC119727523 [Patiria miniata]
MGLYQTWTLSLMISYVFLISICCADLEACNAVDDCSCKLSDGKEINIRSLGSQGGTTPRFPYELAGSWKYAYNPCYPWSDTTSCQNVAACQEGDPDPTEKYAIGDATPATWTQENNKYVVKYSSTGGGKTRTSVVVLACDTSATEPKLERLGSKPDPQDPDTTLYDFILTSKCCCPGECGSVGPTKPAHTTKHAHPTKPHPAAGGISIGSVMCIIVSVLIIVYVVAGVLFMKFVRHAEGMEIIPNRNIWGGLFRSIRDGFMFVFTCGKNSGYDTMK